MINRIGGMAMWEQQLIKTSRGTFEAFTKGEGKPICITHHYSEFNANGNLFANPFTEHYQVFLVNLRGTTNSAPSESETDLSMGETVKDLEAIRKALNFEDWAFAGHSAGGMLGLVYALNFPESLTKIFVCGAAASKNYMMHPDSIYCKENPNNPRLRECLQILNNPESSPEERRTAGRDWYAMSLYRPEKMDEYTSKPNSGKSVPKRLDYFAYKEVHNFDLTEQLSDITVPTLVACGRYDAQCPHDCCVEIAEGIPHSKLITFEESNHNPFVEEPEKFVAAVKEFYLHKMF
ncbi:alpha/beta fold hydrolase [Chungangia koreensis]|uniref:Alpha/beta fold hydrolase n=1 Tax=Chungangia koreensis TaxID=752657 RepID=A0ABV8WZ41_9LACT